MQLHAVVGRQNPERARRSPHLLCTNHAGPRSALSCRNLSRGEAQRHVQVQLTEAKRVEYVRQLKSLEDNKKDPVKNPMRPRDKIRIRHRCRLCGRARAVYRKFGICRICFRDMANKGLIPGVQKASW